MIHHHLTWLCCWQTFKVLAFLWFWFWFWTFTVSFIAVPKKCNFKIKLFFRVQSSRCSSVLSNSSSRTSLLGFCSICRLYLSAGNHSNSSIYCWSEAEEFKSQHCREALHVTTHGAFFFFLFCPVWTWLCLLLFVYSWERKHALLLAAPPRRATPCHAAPHRPPSPSCVSASRFSLCVSALTSDTGLVCEREPQTWVTSFPTCCCESLLPPGNTDRLRPRAPQGPALPPSSHARPWKASAAALGRPAERRDGKTRFSLRLMPRGLDSVALPSHSDVQRFNVCWDETQTEQEPFGFDSFMFLPKVQILSRIYLDSFSVSDKVSFCLVLFSFTKMKWIWNNQKHSR